MLGQPVSMLIPQVVGFRLHGRAAAKARPRPTWCSPSPRCCARRAWSASSSSSSAPGWPGCRSPTARRSATCRPSTARPAPSSRSTRRRSATCASPAAATEQIALVEAYAKEQGLFHDAGAPEPGYSETLELDLGDGGAEHRRPKRPAGPRAAERRRSASRGARRSSATTAAATRPQRTRRPTQPEGRATPSSDRPPPSTGRQAVERRRRRTDLDHGAW